MLVLAPLWSADSELIEASGGCEWFNKKEVRQRGCFRLELLPNGSCLWRDWWIVMSAELVWEIADRGVILLHPEGSNIWDEIMKNILTNFSEIKHFFLLQN
jgi:hypothetical protein